MEKIELANGLFTTVDREDYEALKIFPWYILRRHGNSYVARHKEGKTTYIHREILKAEQGQIVDHIDGDALNNIKSNLRIVTNSVNCFNRYSFKTNKTGYRGVSFESGKYRATLTYNKKRYNLGLFNTAKEAGDAWDIFVRQLVGRYAPTSKIQQKKVESKITLSFLDLINPPKKKTVRSQSPIVAARVKKKLEEYSVRKQKRDEARRNRIKEEQVAQERREIRRQRKVIKVQEVETRKKRIQYEQLIIEKLR